MAVIAGLVPAIQETHWSACNRAKRKPGHGAMASSSVLDRLYAVIASRRGGDPKTSYSAQLLAQGRERCAKKLGEEAVETVIAAVAGDKKTLTEESADLLYHLLVLWAASGLSPEEIYGALEAREGRSGIAEKKSRGKPD